jgi:hypothetical protein
MLQRILQGSVAFPFTAVKQRTVGTVERAIRRHLTLRGLARK